MVKNYVGDIGTRIRIRMCTDITNATTTQFKVKKPDGIEYTWVCTIEEYEDGIIYYRTKYGDFDQAGRYTFNGDVVLSNGDRWLTETRNFDVYEAYK